MGFRDHANRMKTGIAAPAAAEAFAAGRRVFVCRFNVKNTGFAALGQLVGFAEMVEDVEAEGWRLDKMAFDGGDGIFLFRRVESGA